MVLFRLRSSLLIRLFRNCMTRISYMKVGRRMIYEGFSVFFEVHQFCRWSGKVLFICSFCPQEKHSQILKGTSKLYDENRNLFLCVLLITCKVNREYTDHHTEPIQTRAEPTRNKLIFQEYLNLKGGISF